MFKEWVGEESKNIDLQEWIIENMERVEDLRNKTVGNNVEATKKRKIEGHRKDLLKNVTRYYTGHPGLVRNFRSLGKVLSSPCLIVGLGLHILPHQTDASPAEDQSSQQAGPSACPTPVSRARQA